MSTESVNEGMTPHAGDGCAVGAQVGMSEYTLLKQYAKATNIPVECLKFEETGVPNTATIVIPVASLPDDYFTVNSISVCHGYARDMFTYKDLERALEDRQRLTNVQIPFQIERNKRYTAFLNDLADAARRKDIIRVYNFCNMHDLPVYAFDAVILLEGVRVVQITCENPIKLAIEPGKNTGLISVDKLHDKLRNIELTVGSRNGNWKPVPNPAPQPTSEDNGPMLHGCFVPKHPGITNTPAQYREPFQECDDELQNAIWNVIKSWDINVPEWYEGYAGAMGNHACAIADAVRAILPIWMRRVVK